MLLLKDDGKKIRFKGEAFMNNTENKPKITVETEKCILCGKDTEIPVTTPIKERKHYIFGCGQICSECSSKMKLENSKENELNEEDLELLLKMSVKTDGDL